MNVIYVDDEQMAITRFELLAGPIKEVKKLNTFQNPLAALAFAKKNRVDVAFLDIEMRQMSGIDLAKKLVEIDPNINIIFVTAYSSYSLAAYEIDALGYVVKPYTKDKIKKELVKAGRMKRIAQKQVYIQTMPRFDVFVDGEPFAISSPKLKELLALLVDRNGGFITSDYAVTYLWEDKPNDDNTKALYRVTANRLHTLLTENGINHILNFEWSQKAINPKELKCDYYDLLHGDKDVIKRYTGEYMMEYSWAEETNAKIIRMLKK